MNITVIGYGNVGGTLARRWAEAGHTVTIGAREPRSPAMEAFLKSSPKVQQAQPILQACSHAQAILVAIPSSACVPLAQKLAAGSGIGQAVLIDATNSVRAKPEPYPHAYAAFEALLPGAALVKCFNTTGFENMADPHYGPQLAADMFMAGDSPRAKEVAQQLALDLGFAACHDFGTSKQVSLLEQFAMAWINLAIVQQQGRGIMFKLHKR